MNTKGQNLTSQHHYEVKNSAFPKFTFLFVVLIIGFIVATQLPVTQDGFGRSFNMIGQEITK